MEMTSGAVSFTRMDEGTAQDYALLKRHDMVYNKQLPQRLMDRLQALEAGASGYQVSRLEHSLQVATRARRDGADADWVVTALLHDLGDDLAPQNHDTLSAAIIAPYVREECSWAVRHHGMFQLIHYGDKVGFDPDAREAFRGHQYFDGTAYFCGSWDQLSFDPSYTSDGLDSFAVDVQKVFTRPAWEDSVIRSGHVTRFAA